MRVIVRADASPLIGAGHVMRCLSLAQALAARGAEVAFVCAEVMPAIEKRIREQGHKLFGITTSSPVHGVGWEDRLLAPEEQLEDARQTLAAAGGKADWIIVDHYQLGEAWEAEARKTTKQILAIDDLANRAHDCDLLLDQSFGRSKLDYATLVPARSRILVGPVYAPLRPEFATARDAALARRGETPARRLLVTLGSTDLGGITRRVVEQVLAAGVQLNIDVVLGAGAASLPALEALARVTPRLRVHLDVLDMSPLMTAADLAIGAAGSTTWERCCLGLPTVALILAPNQRFIAEQVEAAGAHRLASGEGSNALVAALIALMEDDVARGQMAKRAAEMTDGHGASRLCAAMLDAGSN
jgi:UDP-2,4-diacetamido-2,4,6-trideoxy-beta-L-altropyranose hydrolase